MDQSRERFVMNNGGNAKPCVFDEESLYLIQHRYEPGGI